MQQSPFNASTDTPDTAVAPINLQTTQHGLSHQDATAPPGLSQGDLAGGSEPLPIAGRRRGSPASSATSDYGLNTPTASPRPGNKIFEYESALTPISRRSSDERLFEVIDGPGRGGLNGSPIANLPNGMRTVNRAHIAAVIADVEIYRVIDPCIGASVCRRLAYSSSRLPSLPFDCDKSALVASRIRPFLPGSDADPERYPDW